jgi:uncharacterized protein (DUF1501 family)
MPASDVHLAALSPLQRIRRRTALRIGCGAAGLTLPQYLQTQAATAEVAGSAKSCIVLFCWGGMSHIDTFDPKPNAPSNVRGEFKPIDTATPGIRIGEHLPRLAKLTQHLAIVRSMHHGCTSHGKGMYWNMTGHPPPAPSAAVNLPPSRNDWPSLAAMVSTFRQAASGMPPSVRLPYPLVDNGTLQAGESGGWLGIAKDPIVIRTPKGKAYGGVSRDLGSPVLNLSEGVDRPHLRSRRSLLESIERPVGSNASVKSFAHFQQLALDMLATPEVTAAFDLDRETKQMHDAYGDHICGQSVLLARRLSGAGVPIVTVVCAAGDLNGSKGDHWDTHADNFNRLKKDMLPPFDRAASALITDLDARGRLDETLVVMMGDFGRTPKVNGGAGRDHYPYSFSVVLAGGGIRGGQVYGSSDKIGAFPHNLPCGPGDLHATIFEAMGISSDALLYDNLRRPHRICTGRPLPLT